MIHRRNNWITQRDYPLALFYPGIGHSSLLQIIDHENTRNNKGDSDQFLQDIGEADLLSPKSWKKE
jgi:hypothetical protein